MPGVPRPQGSKRHVGNGRMVEVSPHVKTWRSDIMAAADRAHSGSAIGGPVSVDVCFSSHGPKGHYGTGRNAEKLKPNAPEYPDNRTYGDADKLARSLLDAISCCSGYPLIEDDSRVTDLCVRKRYATRTSDCGALVRIMSVS